MSAIDRLIEMDRTSPKLILVVGEPMTDVYVQGRLEPCQEACPKFMEENRTEVPGGAANARRSLQHWRTRARHIWNNYPGPIKTRFMVGDECVFRHDDDQFAMNFPRVREDVLAGLLAWRPDGVLLSDYDKGLLTPDFIRAVAADCARRGVPCVADAKRGTDLYAGCIVKGNLDWHKKGGIGDVVTRGGWSPIVRGVHLDSSQLMVRCLNHVGAGDCFAAHLTLALAYGLPLAEAAAIAHSAGRVYVQHRYNTPPTLDAIREDVLTCTSCHLVE